MNRCYSLSLKLLSLFFLWYVAAFVLTIASTHGIGVPAPDFRGDEYAWDFELFFAVIYAVWGLYLWKASESPHQHRFFVDFTLWATVAHIAAMVAVGLVRTHDLTHLLIDAVALGVPTGLVVYFRLRLK